MNPRSMYCLIRMTSRSGLGASPRMKSTSSRLRTTSRAILGSEIPRGGREAFVKEGLPASSAIIARQSTARAPALRSSLREDTSGIASEIGENNIGAGAADGGQRFHHRALIFQPSTFDRGHQHTELARDLISGD